jgi:3D (Asp-Asp-Asp) domain-containing protein
MSVAIDRAKPVTLESDGARWSARTLAATVGALLKQEGIALEAGDQVTPDAASPLPANAVVRVSRVRDSVQEFQEPISPPIEYVDDPSMEIGRSLTTRQGTPGVRKWTVRTVVVNGREQSRETTRSWVETPPIATIIARGTKPRFETVMVDGVAEQVWATHRFWVTAYSAATSGKPPDHPAYGITSTGERARRGIVAVDPSYVPYGTRMYIPGYGIAIAADTGGGVKGAWLDVCFDDEEPIIWATGFKEVYLLAPAPPAEKVRHLVRP